MIQEIILFEIKYRLRRPATYIYLGILFFLAFLAISTDAVVIGGSVGNVHRNSPLVIMRFITLLSAFGMLVTSAMMSVPIYRDFEHNSHTLFFTTPLTKSAYIWGRYLGSFLITIFVFLGIPLGILLGSIIAPAVGWAEADKFDPFNLDAYLKPVLFILIPNLFFTGSIFFALATLTRNMLVTYVGNVGLLVLYLVTLNSLGDLEDRQYAAIIDPFGLNTLSYITRYWTAAESNTLTLPFTTELLLNRLLWISISGIILFLTYNRFTFSAFLEGKKNKNVLKEEKVPAPSGVHVPLPKVSQFFGFSYDFKQMLSLAWLEIKTILKEVPFIAIVSSGIFLLLFNARNMGKIYDTATYPVTYQVIDTMGGTFGLFIMIIITFYAGELIWRERSVKMGQIVDALPIPDWLLLGSKIVALFGVIGFLQIVLFMICVLLQAGMGFFEFNFSHYFTELLGLKLLTYCLIGVLAIFVQVMVNNKFLGHFILVLYYIASSSLDLLDFNHNLYKYAEGPRYMYSDMNAYGHFLWGVNWFNAYWAAFALILSVVSSLFYVRGTEETAPWRIRIALKRFSPSIKLALGSSLVAFVGLGGYIYYNTNILNEYTSSDEQIKELVDWELTYKKYEKLALPKVVAVKVDVDIYPEELRVVTNGTYWLKNKLNRPIDTLFISYQAGKSLKAITFNTPTKILLDDNKLGARLYKLERSLAAGDSIQMKFQVDAKVEGFTNSMGTTAVVHNGTFFNNQLFPYLGYSPDSELSDKDKRKKHNLPPRMRAAPLNDSTSHQVTYISRDADWVNFEATVSTSPDQIAIAPGYLQKEWTQNGRKYFHYKMDSKILNFYAFLSARYEVKRDKWKDVNIEIYYHKGHEYNLNNMIESIKHSLEYYTKYFSPYQHKQVRIIEFPRYSSFAQSFPNTIPYSESIGFIAKIDPKDDEDLDYVYFVTAHEVAHQWWAHQVIGAAVQGATLMSETLAEYSALMVMQQKYGKNKMNRFLKHELDDYLSGRGSEPEKELPLYLNENQQYLHYNKGSLVMYALQDYIGEDSLNAALAKYIKAVGFQEPPYTTSTEFLKYIRAATPDSLQYLVTDMFETITLYSNRVIDGTYQELPNGKYKVSFEIEALKMRADSVGNETNISLNDWIDIGIFTEEENATPIYLQKRKINQKNMRFEIIVDKKPYEVGIDPYNKLIDRVSSDNRKKITLKKV